MPVLECLSIKWQVCNCLKTCKFIKKRLEHRCYCEYSCEYCAKFLRTPTMKNIYVATSVMIINSKECPKTTQQ